MNATHLNTLISPDSQLFEEKYLSHEQKNKDRKKESGSK